MRYEGLVSQQLPGGPELVLFAAPAHDISLWAGIPQRRRIDTGEGSIETAGFQREEAPKRIADLARFMSHPENVIQNPLLAAVQDFDHVRIVREGDKAWLEIDEIDLASANLDALLDRLIENLKRRVPALVDHVPPSARLEAVRRALSVLASEPQDADPTVEAEDDEAAEHTEEQEDPSAEAPLGLFDEESQVVDFFEELLARRQVLAELGTAAADLAEVAGFSREFLEAQLQPVVLVDGQHRLRGALAAIEVQMQTAESRDAIAALIDSGASPEDADRALRLELGRTLPISLLMTSDPEEHVFQFVVVNQKATPMSKALLGTIVSTSLTHEELEPIRLRLQEAGIELEGSRTIAYMARANESPFKGIVSTGVAGDQPRALPWNVLGRLIEVVRHLDGGVPDHPPLVDYAKLWREGPFQSSGLVDSALTGDERMAVWSANDGPWRMFFIKLHTAIRDKFGDATDMRAHNAWGSTNSNLFNLISLRILTVDFFNFLHSGGHSVSSWSELDALLDDWIGDLNGSYFNRDWRMAGTKKDQPKIRRAWSEAWAEYRIVRDRLPRVERYNPGGA